MSRTTTCIALVALLVASAATAGEYAKAVRSEASLISYYTFDDASPKDTKAAHHGKIVGSGVSYPAGLKGRLGVYYHVFVTRKLDYEIGSQSSVLCGDRFLLDEITIGEHPCYFDDPFQLDFPPSSPNDR